MPDKIIIEIQFTFTNGELLTLKSKTFKQALQYVSSLNFQNTKPLKILFPSTNKVLYYDEQSVEQFLNNQITQHDLVEKTQCDGLYRNINLLLSDNHQELDPGSLFMKKGNNCVLVNDDEYVAIKYEYELFKDL